MQIVERDVTGLHPYVNNPRKNADAVAKVAASIVVDGDIAEIDGKYRVTRDGKVFSFWLNHKRWKEQKLREHTNGYMRATIFGKDFYVHRLVALCFCENEDGKPEVNHKDGKETMRRRRRLTDDDVKCIRESVGLSDTELAREFGVARSMIYQVRVGRVYADA